MRGGGVAFPPRVRGAMDSSEEMAVLERCVGAPPASEGEAPRATHARPRALSAACCATLSAPMRRRFQRVLPMLQGARLSDKAVLEARQVGATAPTPRSRLPFASSSPLS